MQRGKFISFEGSEGCGKSTQIERLVSAIESSGYEVLLTREPGGTAIGEKVREILQFTPEAANMTDECELLLFAASRAQLVREVIEPALDEGKWVIADRFLDSTTVYQGIARGLDLTAVSAINKFAIEGMMPDLTLLLDMDAAVGHARALASRGKGSSDRIEDQPLAFFEAVRRGYLSLAKAEKDRITVIDATQTIELVAEQIWKTCDERFNLAETKR